ncbi:MAG: hypothetical protein GY938_13890 [Ketobacter sp.]|nr:hypothetical protein [Ketobacter sp.]
MKAFWGGTLMRYFLFSLRPEPSLSGGIIEASSLTGLILLSGPFQCVDSGSLSTTTVAIALSTITARTDSDLGMTPTTMIEVTGRLHRQKKPMRAGLMPQLCNTGWVVHLHGFLGYGVNLDCQIIAGVIPFSTAPEFIKLKCNRCQLIDITDVEKYFGWILKRQAFEV